ncbi:hypothetical protein [Streptomyces sulphureus]|uniref:hypothetical protein n=1 Tax=Streptomyces sulphureus TaxID=47758 RepID=UPI00037E8CCB|nr:hypothetical protein [Streptomyces sulphureus]
MAEKEPARAEGEPVVDSPWWAGFKPLGGVLLIVVGLGWAAWVLLSGPGSFMSAYGASKIVAVGCVVVGGALLPRRRGSRCDREEEDEGEQTS